MTLETLAMSEEEASQLLAEPTPSPSPGIRISRESSASKIIPKRRGKAPRVDATGTQTTSGHKQLLIGFIAVGFVLSLLLVGLAGFGPDARKPRTTHAPMSPTDADDASPTLPSSPPAIVLATEASTPKAMSASVPVSIPASKSAHEMSHAEAAPAEPSDEALAVDDERRAQVELDRIMALREAANGKPEALDALKQFQERYGNTIVAARARALASQWQAPEAVPAAPPDAPTAQEPEDALEALPTMRTKSITSTSTNDSPPAIIDTPSDTGKHTSRQTAGAAPESEAPKGTSAEWEILHESKLNGPKMDSYWKVIGSAPAKFAQDVWHIDTSHAMRGKGMISVQSFPLDRSYRLTVVGGYRGDAPRQEMIVTCFSAQDPRFTGHGFQSAKPEIRATFSSGNCTLQRIHQKKAWSKETLLAPKPWPAGEFTVVLEIDPQDVTLKVNGFSAYSGAHGLIKVADLQFQLLGAIDTGSGGEEIWFRSVKLESKKSTK